MELGGEACSGREAADGDGVRVDAEVVQNRVRILTEDSGDECQQQCWGDP